ncbi:MAG: DUF4332 domain-containing protein [Anaerolineales bacterium]|nr:DUF4332 domain-containing protein [Anaerolineales bacterium]
MKYRLEDLPCISTQERKNLSNHGIHSADDILQRLALPERRKEFSKTSRIPVHDLAHWAGVADLIRIKGMGTATADLLVKSGQVHSLQEFIERMILEPANTRRARTGWQTIQMGLQTFGSFLLRTLGLARPLEDTPTSEDVSDQPTTERESVRIAAGHLRQNLAAYARKQRTRQNIPSASRLIELAEEAVELRPRLVLAVDDGDDLFRQTMKTRAWRMSRVGLGLISIGMGFFIVFETAATLITLKQMRDLTEPLPPVLDGSSQMYSALVNVSGEAFTGSSVIFALVLIAVLGISMSLAALSPMYVSYPASTLLMNNASHRSFFIKAIQVSLRREQRTSQAALILFALVLIPLVIYTYFINFDMSVQALNPYSLPAAIFGGLIGLMGSSATYFHLFTGVAIDWERERESLKRYLLYMLIHILFVFAGMYAMITAVLTGTNTAYNLIYERAILPNYLQKMDRTCEQEALTLANNDPASPLYSSAMDECDNFLKPLVIALKEPSIRMLDPNVSLWSLEEPSLKWAVNTFLVWMVLTGALLMFVIPYLAIGGWWRGIFYMVLLFAASRLEDFLKANSAPGLGLDASTFGATLTIAFFILTSALLFDWAYAALTEKKKVCPNCQALIDNFVYCPVCGLAQQ